MKQDREGINEGLLDCALLVCETIFTLVEMDFSNKKNIFKFQIFNFEFEI